MMTNLLCIIYSHMMNILKIMMNYPLILQMNFCSVEQHDFDFHTITVNINAVTIIIDIIIYNVIYITISSIML